MSVAIKTFDGSKKRVGSCKKLQKKLNSRNSIITLKNKDKQCFKYDLIAALH